MKDKKVYCPYCRKEAPWVENKEVYGKNYGKSYMCYYCKDCDAYVGCHKNTRIPLGTMANHELREWRKKTHKVIDPLWKHNGMKRPEVYLMLDKHFGRQIHIGNSDIKTCQEIINLYSNP